MTETPQPGWYVDPQNQGIDRWWDGAQWTNQTQPHARPLDGLLTTGSSLLQQGRDALAARMQASAAAASTATDAFDQVATPFTFKSHVTGLDGVGVPNATVTIYDDFIEYSQPKSVSGGKVAAAVMTGGLSLVAGGVKNNKSGGTISLPIRQISSVTTRNDGLRYTIMSVRTFGGVITMRSGKDEITRARRVLSRLVSENKGHRQNQSQTQQVVVNVAAPAVIAQSAEPHPSASSEPSIADQLIQLKSLFDAGVLTQDEYDTKRAALVAKL